MIFNDPYKDDYDHRPVKDAKGHFKDEFYYKGKRTDLQMDAPQKRKAVLKSFLCGFGMLAAALLPGFVEHPASRVLWVTVPWACCFLPVCYYLLGAFEFATSGTSMSRRQYDHSIVRMRRSAMGVLVFAVLNLLTAMVYIILHHDVKELLYICSFIPMGGLSVLTVQWVKKGILKGKI